MLGGTSYIPFLSAWLACPPPPLKHIMGDESIDGRSPDCASANGRKESSWRHSFMQTILSIWTKSSRCVVESPITSCSLCGLAAVAHLKVFLNALRCVVEPLGPSSADASIDHLGRLEASVVIAYTWDMVCLAIGIIPFSRVRQPRDIIAHHIPVFLFLGIGLPFMLRLSFIEEAVPLRNDARVMRIFERINGWGFLSSLNESIMCAQQAAKFFFKGTVPSALSIAWKLVEFIELIYKLAVFTVLPLMSLLACFEYDIIFWSLSARRDRASSTLDGIRRMLSSPVYLRTCIWRLFVATQYPSMATRTWSKLSKFALNGIEMSK